ncbi:hypothetical protein D3C72_1425620 [compost metagenome]
MLRIMFLYYDQAKKIIPFLVSILKRIYSLNQIFPFQISVAPDPAHLQLGQHLLFSLCLLSSILLQHLTSKLYYESIP